MPVLPESPQHRAWRDARTTTAREIERYRMQLRERLEQALQLLDANPPASSDAWFELGQSLRAPCRRLGSAVHCLREWAEPDDSRADIDNDRTGYRSGRRNIHYWDVQT